MSSTCRVFTGGGGGVGGALHYLKEVENLAVTDPRF